LDAVIFRQVDDLHLDFRLMNEKHRLALTDQLQIHLLELPKYILPSQVRETSSTSTSEIAASRSTVFANATLTFSNISFTSDLESFSAGDACNS